MTCLTTSTQYMLVLENELLLDDELLLEELELLDDELLLEELELLNS